MHGGCEGGYEGEGWRVEPVVRVLGHHVALKGVEKLDDGATVGLIAGLLRLARLGLLGRANPIPLDLRLELDVGALSITSLPATTCFRSPADHSFEKPQLAHLLLMHADLPAPWNAPSQRQNCTISDLDLRLQNCSSLSSPALPGHESSSDSSASSSPASSASAEGGARVSSKSLTSEWSTSAYALKFSQCLQRHVSCFARRTNHGRSDLKREKLMGLPG